MTPTAGSAGTPRPMPEWREPGEEAYAGEELLPAGTPVDPAVIGLAAACGHDTLRVRRAPRAALLVFGDELLTAGPPGGRPGPRRARPARCRPGCAGYGCQVRPSDVVGPVADTLPAHVAALRAALDDADLVCTTGGTMHGPVDHLHPALEALGADYVVNTVAVRPGFPMLLARLTGPDGRARFVAGLPGNPQSAIVALVSLVAPAARRAARAGRCRRCRRSRWPSRCPVAATTPTWRWSGWTGPPAPRTRSGTSARRCCAAWPARTGSPSSGPAPAASRATGCRSCRCRCFPGSVRHDRTSDHASATVTDEPLDLAAHEAAVADRAGRRGGVLPGRGPRPRPRSRGHQRWSTRATRAPHEVLREVAAEIAADPDVYAVAVSHRVGPLAIGDVALVAAVSTAHRAAAFAACARLVDEVKARLPIWKRQVFTDGTEEWVNCP